LLVFEDARETDELCIPLVIFARVPDILCSMAGRVTKLAGLIDIGMLACLWGSR